MKALADRRARIARVREVQHLQAVSEAATAEGKVVQLEGNAERLAALRNSLSAQPGMISGAQLGNMAELGQRLDQMRGGLNDAIGAARSVAMQRVGERLEANVALESAERLQTRAVAAMQQMIELRMLAGIRPRNGREQCDG